MTSRTGPGGDRHHRGQDIADLNVEAEAQSASGDSRDGRRERDAAERAPEDPTRARDEARVKMTTTTMTDNKVKEIIAMVQECGGAMTSDQLLKVIEGNQGEDGRIEKYKDKGAGLCGRVKGEVAGLDGTVKGAGTGRDHCSEDIDTTYSYPLVDPRLVEAHDDGTVVQSTAPDG